MESNVAELCGVVLSEPKFSHKTYGEIFYTFELGIERRSGYIDEIRITISERLIFDHTPRLKDFVEIKGQIRTYNELAENHNKLHIVVFAKEIYFSENFGYNENYIYLEGFLCKPPLKRTSARKGNLRSDAGGQSHVQQIRLYSMHRMGQKRGLCGKPWRWDEADAGRQTAKPRVQKEAGGRQHRSAQGV